MQRSLDQGYATPYVPNPPFGVEGAQTPRSLGRRHMAQPSTFDLLG